MTIILFLLINVSILLLAVTIHLYRQLKIIQTGIAGFKPIEITIGARIMVTKEEELQLSKNKEALKIMSKLCEQLISLRLSNIDDKSMSDADFRFLQGEIHALLDIKGRTTELYNKKIDE